MRFANPTIEICDALVRLRASEDWNTVIEWFKDIGISQEADLRNLEGTQLHRAQGAAQLVEFLLVEIRKAPETYAKLKTHQVNKLSQEAHQKQRDNVTASLRNPRQAR